MATYLSASQLNHSTQHMQTEELKNDVSPLAPTTTNTSLHHDSLIQPELFNAHSDRPRLLAYTHSLKQLDPPCHSLHELPLTYPPNSSLGDGHPRADMEWPLLRMFQGRNSELCPDTGSPSNSIGMESGDPNSELANETQTTTPAHPSSTAKDSCPSAPLDAPLSSTSRASKGPSSLAEENPDELLQCKVPEPTACSHFPLLGSRRNKHSITGR